MNLSQVVMGVLVTEKSVSCSEHGYNSIFVHPDANKIDIKKAIKTFFGVEVESVKIIKVKEKYRGTARRGISQTKRKAKKKALFKCKGNAKFDISNFSKK